MRSDLKIIAKIFYLFVFLLKDVSISVNGANILGLMGMPSPSHHIWNSVIMHRLAELGHNVTVLSVDLPNPFQKVPPNVHYIHLEKGYSMYDSDNKMDITTYIGVKPLTSIPMFYDFVSKTAVGISQSKGMQVLLNYPENFKFDLIFYDYTLGPMLLGFLHKFRYPPLIGLTAFLNGPNTIDLMSNHYFPAYIPYPMTNYTGEMNFWQRMENTLIFITDTAYRRIVSNPRIDAIMRPYFAKDTPPLVELEKHTALSMVNSHPAISYVEPIPANVIEVGGMQILDAKPLPKDFEEFVNNSRNGVILVSFGTNMKSSDFKDEQVQVILSALLQLSQYDFIWKFDRKYLKEELPHNILVRSFIPQRDLLAFQISSRSTSGNVASSVPQSILSVLGFAGGVNDFCVCVSRRIKGEFLVLRYNCRVIIPKWEVLMPTNRSIVLWHYVYAIILCTLSLFAYTYVRIDDKGLPVHHHSVCPAILDQPTPYYDIHRKRTVNSTISKHAHAKHKKSRKH